LDPRLVSTRVQTLGNSIGVHGLRAHIINNGVAHAKMIAPVEKREAPESAKSAEEEKQIYTAIEK
jgi:hypothetical protein